MKQTGGNGFYTAAGSSSLFGSGTWCGSGCGKCYKLTSTGSAPSGQGTGGASGQSITVMVTNLCPYSGNERWCPQRLVYLLRHATSSTQSKFGRSWLIALANYHSGNNQYGYQYHFDIMAQNPVIGDNSIVDFEEVACPGTASSDFQQCQCAKGG